MIDYSKDSKCSEGVIIAFDDNGVDVPTLTVCKYKDGELINTLSIAGDKAIFMYQDIDDLVKQITN